MMTIHGKEMTHLHSSHPLPCLLSKEGAGLEQRDRGRSEERVSQAQTPSGPGNMTGTKATFCSFPARGHMKTPAMPWAQCVDTPAHTRPNSLPAPQTSALWTPQPISSHLQCSPPLREWTQGRGPRRPWKWVQASGAERPSVCRGVEEEV